MVLEGEENQEVAPGKAHERVREQDLATEEKRQETAREDALAQSFLALLSSSDPPLSSDLTKSDSGVDAGPGTEDQTGQATTTSTAKDIHEMMKRLAENMRAKSASASDSSSRITPAMDAAIDRILALHEPPSTDSAPAAALDTDGASEADQTKSKAKQRKKRKKKANQALQGALTLLDAIKDQTLAIERDQFGYAIPDHYDKKDWLIINRNKNWRYISLYSGPWLRLPVEILNSMMQLNSYLFSDRSFLSRSKTRPDPSAIEHQPSGSGSCNGSSSSKQLIDSAQATDRSEDKLGPPLIDVHAFESAVMIRQMVDKASEIAIRANQHFPNDVAWTQSSLSALNGGPKKKTSRLLLSSSSQSGNGKGSRKAPQLSRANYLRKIACKMLAHAYRLDEIMTSVVVMEATTALDDIAPQVLKQDPDDPHAQYVNFFHEKIPSRHLAEFTTTEVLDRLIDGDPENLHYLRTRAMLHNFSSNFTEAQRDFTLGIKKFRLQKKATKSQIRDVLSTLKTELESYERSSMSSQFSASRFPSIEVVPDLLSSTLLENQLYFHRGLSYVLEAFQIIEQAVFELEMVKYGTPGQVSSMRILNFDIGRYGGTVFDNPHGPLGDRQSVPYVSYRRALGAPDVRAKIQACARKAIRDQEKFLLSLPIHESTRSRSSKNSSKSDSMDEKEKTSISIEHEKDESRAQRKELVKFSGTSSKQPELPQEDPSLPMMVPHRYCSFHPLYSESHHLILLSHLLAGNFSAALYAHRSLHKILPCLDGHPIFGPLKSLSFFEYTETLERLSDWKPEPFGEASSNLETGSSKHIDSETSQADRARHVQTTAIQVLLKIVARDRDEYNAWIDAQAASSGKEKPPRKMPNRLDGPRVELLLAWLASVTLGDLEDRSFSVLP